MMKIGNSYFFKSKHALTEIEGVKVFIILKNLVSSVTVLVVSPSCRYRTFHDLTFIKLLSVQNTFVHANGVIWPSLRHLDEMHSQKNGILQNLMQSLDHLLNLQSLTNMEIFGQWLPVVEHLLYTGKHL